MKSDHDIEARLREFRPRRPAPLPDGRPRYLRGRFWLPVAAGTAAAMIIALSIRKPVPRQRIVSKTPTNVTLGSLTRLAVERPEQLDLALTRLSHDLLPDLGIAAALQPTTRESR